MRFLQIVNTLAVSDGGPAQFSRNLNRAANALGVDADIISIRAEKGEAALSIDDERLKPLRTIITGIRAADLVILHGYFLVWSMPVALLCVILHRPYVLVPHGALTPYELRKTRRQALKKRFYNLAVGRLVLRSAHAVTVGSRRESEDLAALRLARRLVVVGAGVNPPQVFAVGPVHQPVRLLSMSRITKKKRIDLAIDACAELHRRSVPFTFTIAGSGDGTLLTSLHSQVGRLNLNQHVDFVGQVAGTQKEDLFAASDIFLLPSEDENFGIGVAESLAAGVPVITTRAVAASDFVSGRCGLVLEVADGKSLADAIERLLALPTDAFVDSRAEARQVAERRLSWHSVAARFIELAEEGRRSPAALRTPRGGTER